MWRPKRQRRRKYIFKLSFFFFNGERSVYPHLLRASKGSPYQLWSEGPHWIKRRPMWTREKPDIGVSTRASGDAGAPPSTSWVTGWETYSSPSSPGEAPLAPVCPQYPLPLSAPSVREQAQAEPAAGSSAQPEFNNIVLILFIFIITFNLEQAIQISI